MTIKSVTIDLDGTLLDTIPDLAAAANGMMRELGRHEFPVDVVASFVGRGIPTLVARCLPDVHGDELAHAQSIFKRHYAIENGRNSQLFPGVLDGLMAFRKAGLPMAVVTNKAAAFTEPLLAAMNLAPFFAFAVSGDTLPEKKPHPMPLTHACERFGVAPVENLHIGDSKHDAHAARAAGCPVFLVPYGYNEGQPVQAGDCDAIVTSLVEAAHRVVKAA